MVLHLHNRLRISFVLLFSLNLLYTIFAYGSSIQEQNVLPHEFEFIVDGVLDARVQRGVIVIPAIVVDQTRAEVGQIVRVRVRTS